MGRSDISCGSFGQGSKADEAALLAQATSTATVAAKSVLMSGGSEEVALKTAKAAAESVLNQSGSDNDTISGRSSIFLRRRKAKRQAEVVASMALMSATNKMNGLGSDWSYSHSQAGSPMNPHPYARNITTRTMTTQDEPSVLSGSTKRIPTPRSTYNACSVINHDENDSKMTYATPPPPPPQENYASDMRQLSQVHASNVFQSQAPMSYASDPRQLNTRQISAANYSSEARQLSSMNYPSDGRVSSSANYSSDARPPSPLNYATASRQSLSNDSGKGRNSPTLPQQKRSKDSSHGDDHGYSNNKGGKAADDATASIANESLWVYQVSVDDDMTLETFERRSAKTSGWDPLLAGLSTAFNILTCGPLFMENAGCSNNNPEPKNYRNKSDKSSSRGEDSERDHNEGETVFSNEDQTTLDGRDDVDTEYMSRDESCDRSGTQHHSLSECSSASSVDSSVVVRKLNNSSSSSEGEIQVRSSIRETMEQIVSKSKKNVRHGNHLHPDDWLDYELRNDEGPEVATTHAKPKAGPFAKAGKKFFFRKKTPKKKSA